jgi:menaquinone-dependent protoporphyrinogen IX oxidase
MKKACLTIVLLLISFGFAAPQDTVDTAAIQQKPIINKVLIAAGGSRLEKVVVKNLVDLLKEKSCAIAIIDIHDIQKMNPDSFGAIVLLNAVDKTTLKPEVQKFIGQYEKDITQIGQTMVVISLVSGEQWTDKESSVDAVSQASSAVQPKKIAMKLYKKVAALIHLQ